MGSSVNRVSDPRTPSSNQLKTQVIYSAGYYRGHPIICTMDGLIENGYFGCSWDTGSFQTAHSLLSQYKSQLSSFSCEKTAQIAEEAIQTYKKEKNSPHIGGAIRILHITKNGSYWLKNPPPTHYTVLTSH